MTRSMHTATAKKGTRRVNSAEAFFGCSLSLHPTRKHATRKTYKKIKKEGTATMMEWINVTDSFTEKQRHYSNTYLEIDEVFDNVVEVSLFSSQQGPYEIFISYGILYGIVYVEEDKAYAKREEIKKELEADYKKHKKPSNEFIRTFCEKHEVKMPNYILFNFPDF